MRPDKQLAGLLGLTRCGHDARQRLSPGRHGFAAGRGHRRQHDAVPRHGRPVHAERRDVGRDALLDGDDGDLEPGRDAPLGRRERRPGGGVHVRPRPLGRLHPPGQPGLGGSGAGRRLGHPPRRPVLRRPAGDVQPDWIDTNKIAIPQADEQQRLLAQPDHADGARQAAAAAVLVPPARREGGRRHERRRPLADAGPGRHGEPLRPLQGAQPGRLRRRRTGTASARPRSSIRTRR